MQLFKCSFCGYLGDERHTASHMFLIHEIDAKIGVNCLRVDKEIKTELKEEPIVTDNIKPNYYVRSIRGMEVQAIDIIKAWDLSYSEGEALTHLLRAKFKGCKDEDYKKAISHLKHCLVND